jgi:hypothetical protein
MEPQAIEDHDHVPVEEEDQIPRIRKSAHRGRVMRLCLGVHRRPTEKRKNLVKKIITYLKNEEPGIWINKADIERALPAVNINSPLLALINKVQHPVGNEEDEEILLCRSEIVGTRLVWQIRFNPEEPIVIKPAKRDI